MAVTTSAKRGEARGAASPPSHIKREVIGVVLIAMLAQGIDQFKQSGTNFALTSSLFRLYGFVIR